MSPNMQVNLHSLFLKQCILSVYMVYIPMKTTVVLKNFKHYTLNHPFN